MPSLNRVFIMGNLTRDPELKYTPGGMAVCELSLAVNQKTKDKDETLFVEVTAWDKTADNCAKYLHKGSCVMIEGRLKLDQWQDKESGKKRSKLRVVAQSVQFVGGKGDGEAKPKSSEQGKPGRHSDPSPEQAGEEDGLDGDFNASDVPF